MPKTSRAQTQLQALDPNSAPDDESDEPVEDFDLEADFVANIIEGTAPLTVEFYNYSTGEIASYQWDFDGDGTVDSSDFEPIHTFVEAGTYEVILKVSDGSNISETSLDIEVYAPALTSTPLPTATATATTLPTSEGSDTTPTVTPTSTPTLTHTPAIIVTGETATPSATLAGTESSDPTVTLMPSNTPVSEEPEIPTETATVPPTATHTLTPTHTSTATHCQQIH